MTRPVGYYVHHHGDGHRQRALAIAHAFGDDITLLGTGLAERCEGMACVDLADDRIDEGFSGVDHGNRPASLHYAPFDHEGIRQRTARITQWIAEARPRLMVVDVSVEVAMLARLASVPTVYVRLNGRRLDPPHLNAFQSAMALLAPFHEGLDDAATPAAIRARTFYAPNVVRAVPAGIIERDLALVVIGRGGGVADGARWVEAARAAPAYRWRVIGPCTIPPDLPSNLEYGGWVDDAERMIAMAGVVIGGAGDGVVSTVIAHRRPFICLPEPRPYDEQVSKAQRLAVLGAAIVPPAWPDAARWPSLIHEAVEQASNWPSALASPGGAGRVAQWLKQLSTDRPFNRSLMA